MGKIKRFFCSLCLDNRIDSSNGEPTFDRNIDVSHLATPHLTSSPNHVANVSVETIAAENDIGDRYSGVSDIQQNSNPNNSAITLRQQHNRVQHKRPESNVSNNADEDSSFIRSASSPQNENDSSQLSSPPYAPSPANPHDPLQVPRIESAVLDLQDPHHYSHHQRQSASEHLSPNISQNRRNNKNQNQDQDQDQDQSQNQSQNQNHNQNQGQQPLPPPAPSPPPPPPPPHVLVRNSPSTSKEPTTKLSYDIISVREPLAKILAERQQLLQNQQQQRPGDHEYIEVYGERGSSCFYEEIAGSVTSSATYDQIGAASNHNYQVLVSAYAVASRQSTANHNGDDISHSNENVGSPRITERHSGMNGDCRNENTYDVTSQNLDDPSTGNYSLPPAEPVQKSSNCLNTPKNGHKHSSQPEEAHLTQSIPVYSVINKATRRSNSILRVSIDDQRPPKPPPKNLFAQHQQPITSAINTYDEMSISVTSQHTNTTSRPRSPVQTPSTSSYLETKHNKDGELSNSNFRDYRIPQPPPRYSKHAFNHTTDRPLPSPNSQLNNLNNNNNNNQTLDQNLFIQDDDTESINNGYELLKSNFEDDQIDVGYEKIREPNRLSGGSISSQFHPRHLIDNGGYESVQPIYSSPSNCYEVLNPATASEIAAAAAAKLNVIEKFLNKDQ